MSIIRLFITAVIVQQSYTASEPEIQTKVWKKNTNFGNADNWDGYDSSCGNQIFSFPSWMDSTVISMPSEIKAKQIILPSDGFILFQPGLTTISESSSCQPKEASFKVISSDWYDPDNWNLKGTKGLNQAVGHVERVPCQYDAVSFKGNSSFSVHISKDVTVRKFYWGNESLSGADVNVLLSSLVGSIQFKKKNGVGFGFQDSRCSAKKKDCLCDNYKEPIRRHICSLTKCPEGKMEEENCPNPITPHGFCCPICGFHIKLNHRPDFSLEAVAEKLEEELKSAKRSIDGYATRYKETGAHIILVPWLNKSSEAFHMAVNIKAFLSKDASVLEVTIVKSWEYLDGYSAASEGMSSAGVYFLVLFIILLLAGAALAIFYWRRSGLTVTSIWPSCPQINIPTGLASSVSTPSFAFARFANERISHLNLTPHFGDTIERTERVDNEVAQAGAAAPSSTQAISVEFSNDAYEAVVDEKSAASSGANGSKAGKSEDRQPLVETEHVYDLIEVEEGSSAVLGAVADVKTEE